VMPWRQTVFEAQRQKARFSPWRSKIGIDGGRDYRAACSVDWESSVGLRAASAV
jgi:hypothetical protein